EAALRDSRAKIARELEDAKLLQRISSILVEDESGERLYDEIIDAAMAIMRADFASIQLLDAESGALDLLAWRNFHPESAAYWQRGSGETGSLCGLALEHDQRQIVPDLSAAASTLGDEGMHYYRLSGIAAVQSTPLTSRDGRVIGMMSTHWRQPHE